jgi:hypothetical protein
MLRTFVKARRSSTLFLVLNLLIFSVLSLAQMKVLVKYCGLIPWSTVALGGLAGGFAQNLIDRGFSTAGFALTKENGSTDYWLVALLSIRTKLRYVPIALTVGCSYAFFLPQSERTLFLLMFLSSMTLGFSVDWIFVGLDSIRSIFFISTIPKLLSSIIAIAVVVIFRNILIVPISIFVYAVVNLTIGLLILKSSRDRKSYTELNDHIVRKITKSVWIRITGDAYWVAPGLFVAILSPELGISFLVVDRVVKFFINPSLGVTQALGSYLIERVPGVYQRVKISLLFHGIIATVMFIMGFFVVPMAVEYLSNYKISLGYWEAGLLSCYIFFTVVSRSFIYHYYYFSGLNLVPTFVNILSIAGFTLFVSLGIASTLSGVILLTAIIQIMSFAVYCFLNLVTDSDEELVTIN